MNDKVQGGVSIAALARLFKTAADRKRDDGIIAEVELDAIQELAVDVAERIATDHGSALGIWFLEQAGLE